MKMENLKNNKTPKEEECDCWSVHKNLNLTEDTCGCLCHLPQPPEPQGWEERLIEEFTVKFRPEWIAANVSTQTLKDFIRTELQKAREEEREMIFQEDERIRERQVVRNIFEKIRQEERERCEEAYDEGAAEATNVCNEKTIPLAVENARKDEVEKIKKAVSERHGTIRYDSCYDDVLDLMESALKNPEEKTDKEE